MTRPPGRSTGKMSAVRLVSPRGVEGLALVEHGGRILVAIQEVGEGAQAVDPDQLVGRQLGAQHGQR